MSAATCTIDDCDRPIRNKMRGLCAAHYQRFLKYGDPLGGKWHEFTRTTPAKDRLLARLVPQENGCWLWTGVIDSDGYGRVGYKGKRGETLPRAVYDCFIGPIPEGMAVDHACHTTATDCEDSSTCLHRRCGNPAHLDLVTGGENTRRGNNTRKTVCVHGHDYTPENTIRSNGRRFCRTCRDRRDAVRRGAVAS